MRISSEEAKQTVIAQVGTNASIRRDEYQQQGAR